MKKVYFNVEYGDQIYVECPVCNTIAWFPNMNEEFDMWMFNHANNCDCFEFTVKQVVNVDVSYD